MREHGSLKATGLARPALWFWKGAGTLFQISSLRAGPATLGGNSGPRDTTIQVCSRWTPFWDLQSMPHSSGRERGSFSSREPLSWPLKSP